MIFVGGCSKKDSSSEPGALTKSGVVAEINGKPISEEEFNKRYQWYVDRFKFQVSKAEFLKNLINLELSYHEALHQKLDKDEKLSYDYKVLLSQHLLEKEVYAKFNDIKVSDDDLKKYFEASPEIRASHILFKLKEKVTPEEEAKVKKQAEEILKKVKKGENFSKLAKKYSDGPSAKNGGDLDYFTRESMVKEFSDVAFALKKIGDTSDLVRTKYGYHIIQLTGRRTFKEADQRRLKSQLRSQKQKEIYEGFFEELRKKADIRTNEALLKE